MLDVPNGPDAQEVVIREKVAAAISLADSITGLAPDEDTAGEYYAAVSVLVDAKEITRAWKVLVDGCSILNTRNALPRRFPNLIEAEYRALRRLSNSNDAFEGKWENRRPIVDCQIGFHAESLADAAAKKEGGADEAKLLYNEARTCLSLAVIGFNKLGQSDNATKASEALAQVNKKCPQRIA